MTDKEKSYAQTFKRTCEVTMSECGRGKWCASCMHCANNTKWNFRGFEHNYCMATRKENANV